MLFSKNIYITKEKIALANSRVSIALFSFLNDREAQQYFIQELPQKQAFNLVFIDLSEQYFLRIKQILLHYQVKLVTIKVKQGFFTKTIESYRPHRKINFFLPIFLGITIIYILLASLNYHLEQQAQTIQKQASPAIAKINKQSLFPAYLKLEQLIGRFPIIIKELDLSPDDFYLAAYVASNNQQIIADFKQAADNFLGSDSQVSITAINPEFLKLEITGKFQKVAL